MKNALQKEDIAELKARLRSALKSLDLYAAILFGSYAEGRADEDSDIDLVAIFNKHSLRNDYKEKKEDRMAVRRALHEINRDYPLDIFTFTRMEWEQQRRQGTSFIDEILSHGVEL